MIKSMTGFGRGEAIAQNRKVTIEMKSVNHRYLDLNIKMPKKLNFYESTMRNLVKNSIQRGKVDIYLTYEDTSESNICIQYNASLAQEYTTCIAQLAKDCGLVNNLKASELSRYPEVLTMQEGTDDEEVLCQLVQEALEAAIHAFVEMRMIEGENLRDDMIQKLSHMLEQVSFIEEKMPQMIQEYKEKLTKKIQELLNDSKVEESRLLTEVAIFADKTCVEEELVRLRSHIETTKANLEEGGAVGRKLDFIAQEMNREANTILSKAGSLEISNCAIELKTEIEKIREQIQNIE